MKLLTLNTHSLIEKNYEEKLNCFADTVSKEQPEIIALQEVNQTRKAKEAKKDLLNYYFETDSKIIIRKDNHVMRIANLLEAKGIVYQWSWVPIKLGYDIYEEGIAIMSKYPITEVKEFYISKNKDFYNWKSRKVLGIKVLIDKKFKWFYSVHMGWWNDEQDNFLNQWECLTSKLKEDNDLDIYLMGDFNNPAHVSNEGYHCIMNSGWFDTYTLSKNKDDGITVSSKIDGWENKQELNAMRIDYIFKNSNSEIETSQVVFNEKNYGIVSDHFGIMITEK